MVRIGFIVEGDTEKILLESSGFQSFLRKSQIECVRVFNARGGDNLRKPNPDISSFVKIFEDLSVNNIFIITDLEDSPCITKAKEELHIYNPAIQTNILAVKTIESWFLADTKALSQLLKSKVYINEPEETSSLPFDQINLLCIQHTGRGAGNKKLFARRMLKHGFLIEHAASHPHCKSARYLLDKLSELNPS